jgi:hypothetical protein
MCAHGHEHANTFFFFFFEMTRVLLCSPGWPQTHNPPTTASQILDYITSMHLHFLPKYIIKNKNVSLYTENGKKDACNICKHMSTRTVHVLTFIHMCTYIHISLICQQIRVSLVEHRKG